MKQRGFTLIELMIVVAIIAILTTVLIVAQYQLYTTKSRVTEGLVMADPAKLSVSEYTISNNALPPNQAATGYSSPSATRNVNSIVIGANGVITIDYPALAGGGTIILVPTLTANGDLTWDCTGGTLPVKYRPANCR